MGHLQYKSSQLELTEMPNGKSCLIYGERMSPRHIREDCKTASKVATCYQRDDKPEWCLVRLYKKHSSLCPEDHPNDAFYLKPLQYPPNSQWYSRAPIGHNILSQTVINMCRNWSSNQSFIESYSCHMTLPGRS